VLASKCTACHSDPPINNALSGLGTYADLRATSKEDPTKDEAQLSVVRMQSSSSPMPPASVQNPASASDVATLQNWINAGYPSGSCPVDGGAPPDAGTSGPVDVFSGQPPFAPATGGNTHNAGQNCLSCHNVSSTQAPAFLFGGTLYDASGKPVVGAEVRVVDDNGTGYSVHTGPSGTFYKGGSSLATPAHAGARDATNKALMISPVTAGGCSSCHCTGSSCATTPIHLP
jgi:hypothetical protein